MKRSVEDRRLHGPAYRPLLALLLVLLAIPAGMLALMLWPYFRQKRLLRWGNAAKGTMIGEADFKSRSGKMSRVMYTFEDETGATMRGEKAGVPRNDDPRPDFVQHRLTLLANLTVVYDPGNSARNMLYPGGVAQLRE